MFRTEIFPKSELHIYANHLTSSQMLCYNFFRLFIPEELCINRRIQTTPQLREWMRKSFSGIPPMSEKAECEFESKIKDEYSDGTSFDFCVWDDNTTVLFEIKYTEAGFGKAPNNDHHKRKFEEVYSGLLNQQDTVRKDVTRQEFLNNYQLFRNVIRTASNVFVVIIYPVNNTLCKKEYEN